MRRKKVAIFGLSIALLACFAGCAPEPASDAGDPKDDAGDAVAVTTAWSTESDCGSCHDVEASSAEDGTTLYALHVKHESYNECVDCHVDDGGALAQAHADYADPKARMPKKLKNTEVSEGTCLTSGCHSMDELVAATASSTVLTDSNGTVKNPHEMLIDENHIANSNADLACSSCHKMHEENGAESQVVAESAQAKCTGCHHQNVYECGTCHD